MPADDTVLRSIKPNGSPMQSHRDTFPGDRPMWAAGFGVNILDMRVPSPAFVCLAITLLPSCLPAQPKPGDIFREYHYTSDMIVEFDPASKQTNPKALLRRSISGRERGLDLWDLEDAVRAEISM